jgi:CIC family chloride channel protein
MTGSYGLLAPAMITVSIASVVVGDRTIYTSQPATRADSPAHRLSYTFPLLRALHVYDAMTQPLLVLRPETPLAQAAARMDEAGLAEAAVAAEDNTLIGLITRRSLRCAEEKSGATAGDAAVPTLSIESDETLDTALTLLAQHGVHRLPVVHTNAPACLAGIVTVEGITRAYANHVGKDVHRLNALAPGTTLTTVTLGREQRAVGVPLRDLGLPPETLVVSIQRNGSVLIPRGSTVLQEGDELTIVSTPDTALLAEASLCAPRQEAPV